MGCGKSTVGHLIAQRLNWPWVDLDIWIEQHEQKPIKQIFADKGEPYYRYLEEQNIRLWMGQAPLVISLGGGAPCDPNRWCLLKEHFFTIYLKTELQILITRLSGQRKDRPLIAQGDNWHERFRDLLRRRERFYVQADWVFETGSASQEETAEQILKHVVPQS